MSGSLSKIIREIVLSPWVLHQNLCSHSWKTLGIFIPISLTPVPIFSFIPISGGEERCYLLLPLKLPTRISVIIQITAGPRLSGGSTGWSPTPFIFLNFIFIKVELIYNVVSISALQLNDPVMIFLILLSIMFYPKRLDIVPCAVP